MNLQEIRMSIRIALNIDDNRSFARFSDTFLNLQINEAQKIVRVDLEDVIENCYNNFIVDQRNYTMPDDFLKIHQVWINRDETTNYPGLELRERDYSTLFEPSRSVDVRIVDSVNTGDPEKYYISSDEVIYFDPVPTQTNRFDLFFLTRPTVMTTDSDEPDFKEIYHNIVLRKSIEMVAAASMDFVSVQNHYKNNYLTEVSRFQPFANSRQTRQNKSTYHSLFKRVGF